MNSDESFLKKLDTDLSTGNATHDNRRGIFHTPKEKPVADDWQHSNVEPIDPFEQTMHKRTKQQNFFKKMFIGSMIFAVLSVGVFAYSLFMGRARLTGENVQLSVQTKTFADSGEEISVRVTIGNENPVIMEDVKLILGYPLGTTRDPSAMKNIERPLGDLQPGEIRDETFAINLFGEQGTEKAIIALIEYRLQDSNAIFEKTSEARLTLRSSIASVVINAPENVLPGQELPITVTISGNTTDIVRNALLVGEYPDSCSFVRAQPMPTLDRDVWSLGDLPTGSQREVSLTLACSGFTDAQTNIRFTLGSQSTANERLIESVYTSSTHVVRFSQAFLAMDLSVNGRPIDSTVALSQNRDATIDISWQNTMPTAVSEVIIRAKLSGPAFDPTKIRTSNGFFDTNTSTITFSSREIDALKSVQPGQTGRISFQTTPRAGLAQSGTLDLSFDISGVTLGGQQESLIDVNRVSIPVATDLQLIPKILYHSGPLQNTGPMPMQVGKETTFTITWQLANTPNQSSGVVLKTNLPTGITWKNVVAPVARAGEITYNAVTREVVWNAGDVPVGQNAKSISFKVGITPSATQLGLVPNLTTDIIIVGTDTITKTLLSETRRALNTRLLGDTSSVGSDGKVTATQ